ncbi:MAG: hypothetical protein JWM53_1751 [bacterium]|nr:hypothetical protein [bacterium]
MMTRSLFFVSLFALALPACGGEADTASDDASLADDGKADRAGGASSYFVIRADLRRCAAPGCGGSFVKRVNYAATTCVDGKSAADCYVAAVDYSKAKLDDNDMSALAGRPILVKGTIAKQSYSGKTFGNLVVSEVWVGAVGANDRSSYATVSGVAYRVKDNGVRCITWPCPSDHETKLNGTTSRDIAGVDLSSVGATDDQIADAFAAMTTSDGILVDGSNTPVTGPGGSSVQLTAANFYARVAHQDTTSGATQACGGIGGFQCPEPTQWCDPTPVNACGAADLMGVCKVTYLLCSQIYQPVCGCDGTTYSNDCERVRAKIQKSHDGACG